MNTDSLYPFIFCNCVAGVFELGLTGESMRKKHAELTDGEHLS